MPALINDETYAFALAQEVQEKVLLDKGLHVNIPENEVQDLQRIDISGHHYHKAKRFLDFFFACGGFLVLLIPMAILAAMVYLDDPGKIIFSQYRVGLNGKRFKIYKFRSMKTTTPKYLATDEIDDPQQYFTRIGKLLRKFSLDELPQLVNVIKGDMSFIGPRPLISDEYEMHIMRMRFGVYATRPGITGLAQINGRDNVTPVEKIHYVVQYIRDFGFRTDAKILLSTIPKVLNKEDIKDGSPAKSADK